MAAVPTGHCNNHHEKARLLPGGADAPRVRVKDSLLLVAAILVLVCRISLGFYGLDLHRRLLSHSCDPGFLAALRVYSFVLIIGIVTLFFYVLVSWYLDTYFEPDRSKHGPVLAEKAIIAYGAVYGVLEECCLITTLVTFIGKDAAPCRDPSLLRTVGLCLLSLGLLEPAAIGLHVVALQYAFPPDYGYPYDRSRVVVTDV